MDNSDLYYKLEQSAGIDYIKGEIYLTDDPQRFSIKIIRIRMRQR